MPAWIHWTLHTIWLPVFWVVTHQEETLNLLKTLCPKLVHMILARRRELDCVRLVFQTTTEGGQQKQIELAYRMPRSQCKPTELEAAMYILFGGNDGNQSFAELQEFVCRQLTGTNQITLASIRKINEMVVTCDKERYSSVEAALCVRQIPFVQRA